MISTNEYLKIIDAVNENGFYKPNWQSLSTHKTPKWYMDAKLGIFIHWGLYSIPAFGNEWYSRHMYDSSTKEFKHHIKKYGNQIDFGYKDFIPLFKAKKFNAEKWVNLFKKGGFKYVMPVAEHHDGFSMYKSEFNRWNSFNLGPNRDVLQEIKEECYRQGLVLAASTHRAEHYFFMNMGRTIESDVNDEKFADFYGPAVYQKEFHSHDVHKYTAIPEEAGASQEWLEDWLVRTCEIIDKYQPKVLYFDWWIRNNCFKPYLKKLAAYYYNRAIEWGKDVTINYKHEAFPKEVATFDVERGALDGIVTAYWQTDTAIGNRSWGYIKNNKFKSAKQVICDLIDTVSKNGNLLINIGPKPDGTITKAETKVILKLGKWLKINGEGIYNTRYWKSFGEGTTNVQGGYFSDYNELNYTPQDFRFTYKDGYLYVFQMKASKKAIISSLSTYNKIENVTLLGNGNISYMQNEKGLTITLSKAPKSSLPQCFKVKLKSQ